MMNEITNQYAAYICVAILGAEHDGGPALVLFCLDVGLGLEQEAGDLLVIL